MSNERQPGKPQGDKSWSDDKTQKDYKQTPDITPAEGGDVQDSDQVKGGLAKKSGFDGGRN